MSNTAENIEQKKAHYRNYLLTFRNLPSIPTIMLEIARLLESPKTSASDLGRIIGKDQGLAAKILTVANSPLYGLPRRVSTIEFAIVILGFDHIKNIVIAISMMEAFKGKVDKNWNRRAYWIHSLVTAGLSKKIAEDLGYQKSGEAFTAGLLHDLGISVIQRFFNPEFNAIYDLMKNEHINCLTAEETVMGMNHQEIGMILSERWNLPQNLSESIAYHHKPSLAEGENKILAAIVHLADYMTQKFEAGKFDWDENPVLDEEVIKILKLGDIKYLERFLDTYNNLFENQFDTLISN